MEEKTKKSFFKKIHLSNLRYRFGFDADADWLFLSIVCTFFFVAISIFNIVFFFHITKKVDQTPAQAQKATQIIDREKITEVLRMYTQKEEVFLKNVGNKTHIDEKTPSTIE